MALSDLVPHALRPAKPVGGHSAAPRVSGVADDAITPVVEHVAGPVFAWRGQEQHGVTVTDGSTRLIDPHEEFAENVDYEHAVDNHPPTPVLVRIVREDGNEVADWRVITALLSAQPTQILNRLDDRTSARIFNNSAVVVLIGRDATMNVNNSFPLAVGQSIDIKHTRSVWGISIDGSNADVRACIEFARGK